MTYPTQNEIDLIELLRDAERYRFLRSGKSINNTYPTNGEVWVVKYVHSAGCFPEVTHAGVDDELDRAIDFAIKQHSHVAISKGD